MYRFNIVRLLLIPCLFLLFVCLPITGQTATATLSGTVEDQNSAAIPAASITVQNKATSFERTAVTNDSGGFTIPLLPPGTYAVMVRREGFTQVEVSNVVLNVGDQKSLRVELKVGDVNAAIEVRSDETLISTSPAVATTIDKTFVSNLPLNGRSFQSLILLTPGVTVAPVGQDNSGQFNVNGQRGSSNYFTVDGVSANVGITDVRGGASSGEVGGSYAGFSSLGTTNNLVSIDALEEFKIQTSTYTAEFGRQPGGQVSLLTRSGANKFHGALFDYFRNDALDARDYFNTKPLPKPALRQNNFGGTFSGPVFFPNFGDGGPGLYNGKDRTFFFFSYEGLRLRQPDSGITFVPSLRLRQNTSSAVQPLLNAFPNPTGLETTYDHDFNPNTPQVPSGWAPYNYSLSNPNSLDATSIRLDHNVNSKVLIFGRFNDSPSYISSQKGTPWMRKSNTSTRTFTAGMTSILTPRLNNELRFNYSRQVIRSHFDQTTLGGGNPVDPSLLTNGLDRAGTINLSFGNQSSSLQAGVFRENVQRQVNIVDNLSVVQGDHQFKFGVDYRRLMPTYGVQDQQVVYFFSEAALNTATSEFAQINRFDSARLRFNNFSIYSQDTWKASKRLTLDFGLRWEINPAPTDAEDKKPVVVLGITDPPDVSHATLAPVGTPFYKTFYTAFAPRFGFAYQLRTSSGSETVFRGGFGVYYDLGSASAAAGLPLTANKNLFNVPFPLSAADAESPVITIPTALPVSIQAYSSTENLKLPYTLQWSVGLEQAFGSQQSISLSYVGAAARQLLTRQQLNVPAGLFSGPRPNPNFNTIVFTWNGPTSDYHAFQAQYKSRFKNGLQSLVNYTWSHAIDEVSTDTGTNVLSRGNADFDIPHNFSAALNYEIPTPKFGNGFKQIFEGWSVDAIIHAQTGRPLNAQGLFGAATVINGQWVSIRPNVVPGQPFYINDSNVPGGRRFNTAAFTDPPFDPANPSIRQQGNFGRNVLRELPLYQVDMALARTFNLTENLKVQFKGEVFNIFNHPMFGNYDTTYTSSTFGVPRTTLRGALGGLSPLYQLGGPRSIQLSMRVTF